MLNTCIYLEFEKPPPTIRINIGITGIIVFYAILSELTTICANIFNLSFHVFISYCSRTDPSVRPSVCVQNQFKKTLAIIVLELYGVAIT